MMIQKIKITLSAFAFLCLIACGGKSDVEISTEMKGFIDEVSTTSSMVKGAKKYGFTSNKTPLSLYTLKEPLVTEKKDDCYTVSFKHGMAASKVSVCWKDGKIYQINKLGFDTSRR